MSQILVTRFFDKTLTKKFLAVRHKKSDAKEKKIGDDLIVCMLNIHCKVSSRPSLLAINLVKVEI